MDGDQVVRRSGPPRLFARGVTVPVPGGVALLVGTILMVVNQGDVILCGYASWLTGMRVGVLSDPLLGGEHWLSGRLSS